MADNMIELVAQLNVEDSARQINDTDIPKLQKQLKSLNIQCNIDTAGVSSLKEQLKEVSKGIRIAPQIVSGTDTKRVTNETVKAFNEAFGMVGKMGETTKKEFNAQTKQMLQEFKDAWTKGITTGDASAYTEIFDKLERRIREFGKGDIQQLKNQIDEIRAAFTDGSKITIGENLKGWLDNATGSSDLSRSYLDAVYGKGNYTIGKGNVGFDTFFSGEKDTVESIISAAQKILEYQNKIRSEGWGFEEAESKGATFKQVSDDIRDNLLKILGLPKFETSAVLLDTDDLEALDAPIKEATSALEAYGAAEERAGEQAEYWRKQQELTLQDYEKTVAKIEKAKLSVDEVATREEVTSGETVNYNERFKGIMDKGITNAAELKEARDALAAINKEFQILNAQMVSELPQNVIESLTTKIPKAESQIKTLTVDFEKLSNPSEELVSSFEKLKALAADFDFSVDFSGETKESLNGKVKSYTKLKTAIDETKSVMTAFQKEEKKAFQDENRVANLQNRISKLTAEVNRYATANERAVNSNKLMSNGKSFADEWSRITTQMTKGAELSDREVKDLTADMAVFKKEASAAGLAGASAWGKFLNSFKVMSSYLTANMVFNMVKRQLREMAEEVIAVDTAMTELRKVTEATNADFERFAKSAAQTGRELGASISDVINATATFARLGESLPDAEELGRVATLFKNVGDGITEEEAAEDLVSTMKAFNIEAKDSISIVDKFNEVGKILLPQRNYIG